MLKLHLLAFLVVCVVACKGKSSGSPSPEPSKPAADELTKSPAAPPTPAAPPMPTVPGSAAPAINSDADYVAASKALHEQAIEVINANIHDCANLAVAIEKFSDANRSIDVAMARYAKTHPDVTKDDMARDAPDQKDLEKRAPLGACGHDKAVIAALSKTMSVEEVERINREADAPAK